MREIPTQELLNRLRNLNPHWGTGQIDPLILEKPRRRYFKLFYPLAHEMPIHRAVILMGPRRVGKTVLLLQTIQQQIIDGVQPTRLAYIPVDTPLLQGQPLEALVKLYMDCHGMENVSGCHIYFDEIQYLPDWSRHLKVLVDTYPQTRFIASGSAAAALKLSSSESGAGRFTDFTLPPLTFYEFISIQEKLSNISPDNLKFSDTAGIIAINKEFINYINYGGYPEAVFDDNIKADPERFIRGDIIDKVLLRDLPSLYGVQDTQELSRLFTMLAYQTGNEITLNDLSSNSGIKKYTIRKELEYLAAAFLIKPINRVSENGKTFRRIDYFKVYLTNPSMYSALFGLVDDSRKDLGSLVETALFSQYMHDDSIMRFIHYARWRKGARKEGEVDIVQLNNRFKPESCIEVKWSDRYFDQPNELKSLIQFCHGADLKWAVVTTKTKWGVKNYKDIEIFFIPTALASYWIGKKIIEEKDSRIRALIQVEDDRQLPLTFR